MNNKPKTYQFDLRKSISIGIITTLATVRQLMFSKKMIGIIFLCLIPIIVFSLWSADAFPKETEILYGDRYGGSPPMPEEIIDEDLNVNINQSFLYVNTSTTSNNEKVLKLSFYGETESYDNYAIDRLEIIIFLYITEYFPINLAQFIEDDINGSFIAPIETDEIVFRGVNAENRDDLSSWEFSWTSYFLAAPVEYIETLIAQYQPGNPDIVPGYDATDGMGSFDEFPEFTDMDIKDSIRLGFFVVGLKENKTEGGLINYDYIELYPIFDGESVVDLGVVGQDIVEVSEDEDGYEIYMSVTTSLFFLFIIPIITILFAISAVRDDIEDHTIVYLITRPISKKEILFWKFKGFFISSWIPIALSMSISFFIVSVHEGTPFLHLNYLGVLLGAMTINILAYGALFFIFAVVTSYPIVISLLYVFFWETLIPYQPNVISRFSVLFHVQSIAGDLLGDIANITLYQALSATDSFFILCIFIIFAMGFAISIFSNRDFT